MIKKIIAVICFYPIVVYADSCMKPQDPWLELTIAIRQGNLPDISCFIKFVNINGYDSTDIKLNTPLHLAVKYNQINSVKHLVKLGADKESFNLFHETPLYFSVRKGRDDIAAYLILNGANIEAKDYSGASIVYLAVRRNNFSLVNLLLEKGARTNLQIETSNGKVDFLNYAKIVGDKKIIDLIMNKQKR
ncbi:ankyrin repeat domain-containing protein [Zooshikella harenae]|uniref:Ankyrin repeat domain-containing protein n=1 Tax=Zooshikella harenae TaxID=2827238 RepID=A0ABS5ZHZ1_9GAMM|nr:ankyrin repeat domain-containing protein [Zooshikella harenae]MBU2713657.1 ankyrin repeat domain-containing protein [Zooshikella harenae]